MSACISRHGEYSEHTPDGEYTCQRCYVVDEEAMRAEIERLRTALTADRPSVTDNARAEWPLRCDGTPHPEGAIPPLSEHDYRWDGDDPYVVCARCGERRDALTASRVLDYHRRAETTTAHECDSGDFDRTICGCGAMHSYCTGCGTRQDDCRAETTTATTEDAARVIDDACYGGASSPQEIAQALADAGLLATARTRPTREQIAAVIHHDGWEVPGLRG